MNPKDFLILLIVSFLWGGSFLFIRLLVLEGMEPLEIVSMRMLLASIFIMPFLLNRSKKHSFKDHSLSFLLIGILNTALPFTLFAYASLQLGAGSLSVLQATVPILTALILFSLFKNEFSISKLIGVLIGFVGLYVLVGPGSNFDLFSSILCVVASLSYSVAGVYLARTPNKLNNTYIGMGSIIIGAIILSPFLFYYFPNYAKLSIESWLYLIALGVVNTALAYVLFIKLIKRIGPINASFVTYLVPISSISLGIIFLDEEFLINTFIGSLLIFVGVFFANRTQKDKKAAT